MAPLGLITRQVNKMIIGGGMAYTFLKIKDSTQCAEQGVSESYQV